VESRIERYLEENFKKIMLALVVVAVLLAAWFTSRHFTARRNLEAAERFAAATGVEDCDVVIQKYAGTPAAGNALLQKADLLWQEGKKQSSIDALQEFIKNNPSHSLRPAATIGLGTKQAAIGDKDAARTTMEGFLKLYPKSELAPAAEIQLGDLLWQEGKDAEAKKLFESLLQKYPGRMTMFTQALDERQQLMGSGLPQKEVEGPPPPPKPATVPPAMQPPKITLPPLIPRTEGVPPGATASPPVEAPPPTTSPESPVPPPLAPVPPPSSPPPAPAPELPGKPKS
jgi:tetratricopeptide (TPR) repeat protein